MRSAGGRRGLALLRVLARWDEVAGAELAPLTRPLRISHGRDGMGGTLDLLVLPSAAPMVQLRLPELLARVNACCGHAAVARIRPTQTAPEGFAEGATPFAPRPAPLRPAQSPPDPALEAALAALAAGVANPRLRAALEGLGRTILSRQTNRKGP
ncbi:MAG: DUF721 domain-containing protein [Rhodobacteraceae bacterium]|nr:DUF721 domain-containing protein [Paracoccaceae bacterium]